MASQFRLLVHADNVPALGYLSIPLQFGENRFGRTTGTRLPSLRVSREHFSIFVFFDHLVLLDYSRTGTAVNGNILLCSTEDLLDGDIIQAGEFTFMLMQDPADDPVDLSSSDEKTIDSTTEELD